MLYDDLISVRGERRGGRSFSATFAAAVFDEGLDEPVGEGAFQSTRRRFSVLIPRAGLNSWGPQFPAPQVGDELTLAEGVKATVTAVAAPIGMDWEMEARTR